MNQVQTEVIFLNLLRQADEFIFSILGMNPTPDAGSFRARVSALFEMFNADKYNFVLSPVHLGFLATLIKEYEAFRKSEITQIGTPEILIGQIRWEDIYDKPDILAASSDWADITNKPATYPPATHNHAYADITDKPATFAPRTASLSYIGNGTATRILSFNGGFTPVVGVVAKSSGASAWACFDGSNLTSLGLDTLTISINESGIPYKMIVWG